MAQAENVATKNLNEGTAEALNALLQSFSPGSGETSHGDAGKLSADQVRKISDKLGEILGGQAGPADSVRRNERGELVNEEGLPIIDIAEPVNDTDLTFQSDPSGQFDDPDLLPLWTLSSAEKARRKAERERILDLLEEEERSQEQADAEVTRERHQEEIEKRKEAAQKEIESIKKARDLQKKMGRALMRSVVENREKEEKQTAEQAEHDRLAAVVRMPKKKSVSFADDIDEDGRIKSDRGSSADWGDVAPGTLRPKTDRQPMKMHVVERHPRSLLHASQTPEGDSDDESDPGSVKSNGSGDRLLADGSDTCSAEEDAAHPGSDEDDDEMAEDEKISDWNGEDFSHAQHQREIALEYYTKRRDFGAEAISVMRAHNHDQDEWDQPEVPLEATLASPPPQPSVSRFKVAREAHSASSGSSLASHSIGGSIIPASSSSVKRALRMGKLANGNLVGAEDSESDDEVAENTRALLEALTKGDATNIGPGDYETVQPTEVAAYPPQISGEESIAAQSRPSKVSRFKLSVTKPDAQDQIPLSPTLSSAPATPISFNHRSSPKLFARDAPPDEVLASSSSSTQPRFTLPPELQAALKTGDLQSHSMIVESPSFLAPQAVRRTRVQTEAIVSPASSLSPSSTAVPTPTSAGPSASEGSAIAATPMRQNVVERHAPAVVNTRTSNPSAGTGAAPKVSRFKARRP